MIERTAEEVPQQDGEDRSANGDRLSISLLGEFVLRHGETAVPLTTPSYQSLLAYLIIHASRAHSRQSLAFQFWPESTEKQARTNLRKALFRLRRTLPYVDSLLSIEPETVQWRREMRCTVDVLEFETAVAQIEQTNSPAARQKYLQRAISTYQGEFLPGIYDDWVLDAREKYRRRFLFALETQLKVHENLRQYPEAIRSARRLLREDPLLETAYRRLMRLQSLNGDVAGALRTYHDCSTRLQRELGVDPGRSTKELYEQLLNIKTPSVPLTPLRLPLVGRNNAWQALQTAWSHCSQDGAAAVLLVGEAGIGKTRLAEEMLDWAERLGIVTLTSVCYPSEKQLAYAPLAAILRSDAMQAVLRRAGERQLVECSRLLPELLDRNPDLPDPAPLTESWQRQHFFSALAQIILQLRQPFLLFIDDLPSCDQDSLDWLLYLLSYDPEARFLLLSAARSEEMVPEQGPATWQRQLEKEGLLTTLFLRRLNVHDSARLAGHVLSRPLDQAQADRLYAETEGNPLFVVEIARSGLASESDDTKDARLPPKVQSVIETRLARLSRSAYELAQLAAVIGRSFTFTLLDRACKQDGETIVHGLDELWQHRLIREHGSDAYDFSHDKIRQVADGSLSPARRRHLHRQVSQALESLHAANLDPVSGQIAAHYEAAGHYLEAVTYYQKAAAAAQAVYANADTLGHLQRAIELFAKARIEPQQALDIYEQQGDVLVRIGRFEKAETELTKCLPLTTEPLTQARLHRKIANSQQLRRQHDRAFATWQIGEECLGDRSDDWPAEFWQEWLWIQIDKGWVLYWAGRLEELQDLLDRMSTAVSGYGTRLQQGLYFQRLAILTLRRDRFLVSDETIEITRKSFEMIQESGTASQVAFARFNLGNMLNYAGWDGYLEEAEYHMKLALALAEEMNDLLLTSRCLMHLSLNYMRQGDMDSVSFYLPKGMALARDADILEYVAVGEALQCWYAWRNHDYEAAESLGEHAFAMARDLPFGWPARWTAALPLMSIALNKHELKKAIAYGRMVLAADQMRLRDDFTAVLHKSIAAWENGDSNSARASLEQDLELAITYSYL